MPDNVDFDKTDNIYKNLGDDELKDDMTSLRVTTDDKYN